jgi:hypothetical protein
VNAAGRTFEEAAEFFSSLKDWLGSHRVEVYDPLQRGISTLVRTVFLLGGGILGGFAIARLFPEFLSGKRARKPAARRINDTDEESKEKLDSKSVRI